PERVFLVICYVLMTAPLPLARFFPKVWILLTLFLVVGRAYWRQLTARVAIPALVAIVVIALFDASRHQQSLGQEPIRRFQPISLQRGAIFSASPAISRAGLFYESIGNDRYELRWRHDGVDEEFSLRGEALHPRVPDPNGPTYFELV